MPSTSEQLFARALQLIPGGVNSPVRAFRSVGGTPFFTKSAHGATLVTADGRELIDFVCTWGPAIHGHNHPRIKAAIAAALENGTSFGTPNPYEVEMAELIVKFFPSIQKVRMCNSGTESTMSAIRLARGFTKRDKIIKFDGCYHGHADSLLVKAGSGALTFGHPDSAGVPAALAQLTIVLPYNDTEAVKAVFAANKNEIAGIIVEPVPGNAGLYLPKPGYLEFLSQITKENGAVLIFDEVMTGFRLAPGGAQQRFGITPDISTFGKIIGGGLPVGAFGGRADIMDYLAPLGPVYQAGTLSGNPLAMAAGLAALSELGIQAAPKKVSKKDTMAIARLTGAKPTKFGNRTQALPYVHSNGKIAAATKVSAYDRLENLGALLETALRDVAKSASVPVVFNRCGSMFCGYFTSEPVWNLADAMKSDRERFKKFFHGMLDAGVYLAPSQFEAGFISTAHSEADIEKTVNTAAMVMKSL